MRCTECVKMSEQVSTLILDNDKLKAESDLWRLAYLKALEREQILRTALNWIAEYGDKLADYSIKATEALKNAGKK